VIDVLRRGRLRRPLLILSSLIVLAAGSWVVVLATRESKPLSKLEYEQKVRSAYGDVQRAFRQTKGANGAELAARVAEAQKVLRNAADELAQVKPPVAVTVEHDQLVTGLRDYADDLEGLHKAIEDGDSAAIERFNAGISQNDAVRRIAAAAEHMLEKGFDVGPIAKE
jgi:hypothetical protein